MDIIPLGPFMLDFDLLVLAISAFAGYAAIAYGQRKIETDPKIRDKFFNAIILGLAVWKLSFAIFGFSSLIRYPLSLLYYDGGWRGAILGAAIAVFYLWIRTRKDGTPWQINLQLAAWGWVTGSSMYVLLLIVRFPEQAWFYLLLASVQITAALILFMKRQPAGNKAALIIVLLMAGWGIHQNIGTGASTEEPRSAANVDTGTRKGMAAPDFELVNLSGKPLKLSDYAGKKVLLNFWASWCPPCKAEMPQIEKISRSHESDTVVLGVNLTHTEKSQLAVSQFAHSYALSFPILLDERGTVANTYRVKAYPTTYVIDSGGIIREIYEGVISEDMMNKVLKRID